MSQPTTSLLLADQILVVLSRAAKNLKKGTPDQKLAICQNEIARLHGYPSWAILHKRVCAMTQSQLEALAAHVNVRKIKCTLFTIDLIGLSREFKSGEAQAVVLSDSKKIQTMMKSNHAYYYNPAKVYMHMDRLHDGFFEVPLVVPEESSLDWIEGFHQVNAALEKGMIAIPIGTSLALAPQLKSLVGVDNPGASADRYDFSECDATVM